MDILVHISGMTNHVSQLYFFEQIEYLNEMSLCFGLISMYLIGGLILSFGEFNATYKIKMQIVSIFYVVLRQFIRASYPNYQIYDVFTYPFGLKMRHVAQ